MQLRKDTDFIEDLDSDLLKYLFGDIMFNYKEYRKHWYETHKEYMKQYYIENKDKILERIKQRKKNNPDKIKKIKRQWYENNIEEERRKSRERAKKYREQGKIRKPENPKKVKIRYIRWLKSNPEYHKEYKNNKYKDDLQFNISCKMKTAIRKSLKYNKNGRHWEDLVDYNLNELIKHLKSTMPKGYIWNDYIEGKLHIDHIVPVSAFDFTKPEDINFKRCWALGNLRLLPAMDNYKKGNRILESLINQM